ncbi:lipid A-modifier LpxR family protein [Salibaculum griseiflavum]|uniref:DUF2219 domain-containing protein n=1 Tax=Salibaculum griseiflavum TaxID=1914409 RepID=A0A2V1P983_9RHOB|nr:lipid A-modifier LpxR family protein [Salibaculum griseiflavum]PWG17702.1 DUF2219 domain-containing protein [Salibaculum griseiflavum]
MTPREFLVSAALLLALSLPAAAQERETLGWGRILNNDFLGDGKDRWRSSSYGVSLVRGPGWSGDLPGRAGQILEYRLRGEIIAPRALNGPQSDDRAYAGMLSVGLHTHWARHGVEASMGVDIIATGPQTGWTDAQDWFHDLVNQPRPSPSVIANQVPDGIHPTATVELGYPVALSARTEARPFIEAQYGLEDLVRVGVDFRLGELGDGALDLRDPTTGQRYRAVTQDRGGWEWVAGADVALVGDSMLFPAGFGTQTRDSRWRLRLGSHWQGGKDVTFFYGATYLSEEYVGQPEGQVVGSIKLNFKF